MVRELNNGHASTGETGWRLYQLIEPVLARGEEVVLDFAGVKHVAAPFLSSSVGVLIEADKEDRLPKLLRYENLPPERQGTLDVVIDYGVRRRENPRGAAAMDEAVRQYFANKDWD
jgi:hypothetical protein